MNLHDKVIEAAGYGTIGFGDKRSDRLLKIGLDLIEPDECNKNFNAGDGLKEGITSGQICAKGWTNDDKESDTCTGDSGGPIQINDNTIIRNDRRYFVPILLGLTSFAIECATGNPGAYVNTTFYFDFIQEAVNKF